MTRFTTFLMATLFLVGFAWAKGKPGGGGDPVTNPAFVYIGKEQGGKVKGQRKDELFIMSSDGNAKESLGVGGLKLVIEELAWSPDGEWIAFRASTVLYIVKPDGSGLTKLVENPSGVEHFKGGIDWSPDGRYIVYVRQFVDEIEVVEVATGDVTTLDTGSLRPNNGESGGNNVSWSIDLDAGTAGYQTEIAYVHGNITPSIYMLSVDISTGGALTVGTATLLTGTNSTRPVFSPDAETVYFRKGVGGGWSDTALFSIPADGSAAPVQLTNTEDAYFFDVSPDEAYLIWSESYIGAEELFRQDLSTGVVVNITSTNKIEASPRWNPAWTNDLD